MSADAARTERAAPRTVRELYFALGLALTGAGRHDEAVEAFERAIREHDAEPSPAVARLHLAAAHVRAGSPARALRTYLEVVRKEPQRTREALGHAQALLTPDVSASEGTWIQREWAPTVGAEPHTVEDRVAVLSFLGRVKLHVQSYAEARDLYVEARTAAPDDPYVLEGLGEAFWKTGDLDHAVESLRHAEQMAGQHVPSRLPAITAKLSQVLAARGEYAAALDRIERRGIEQDRFAYELHLVRSLSALGVGKPADALEPAELASAMRPHAVEPHLLRTRALIGLGRHHEAVNSANQALQSDPSNRQVAWYRAQALIEGQLDIAQGRRLLKREAENPADVMPHADLIRAVLHGRAEDGNAQYFVAEAHAAFGRPDAALAAVSRALELGLRASPSHADAPAHQLKGELLADLGDAATAAASFYEAGTAFSWRGEYRQAIENLRSASALAPDQKTWWMLADTLRMSDDPVVPQDGRDLLAESVTAWNNGAALGVPTAAESWAYTTRALIAEQSGRTEAPRQQLALMWEAAAYIERAIVLQGRETSRWALLGRYHRILENEVNAIHACERAVADDPNDPLALEEKAAALANHGWFAAAEETLTKRRSIDDTPWAKGVLAYVLVHLNRYDDALIAIEEAIEQGPLSQWNFDLRALCHRAVGRRDLALDDYTTIWNAYDPADVNNLSIFANAAYQLGHLEQARNLFDRLCADVLVSRCPAHAGLGLTCLAAGDLTTAEERLQMAASSAINERELDDLLRFDLPDAEHARALTNEARAVLQRTRERIAARRAVLAVPRSAEDELRAVVARLEEEGQAGDWAWIGATAGLARLLAEAESWTEAIATYRGLEPFSARFPEAEAAVTAIIDTLESRARERARDGDLDTGRALLEQAMAAARALDRPDIITRCHTAFGEVLLEQGEAARAREHFEQAAALESDAGDTPAHGDLCARQGYASLASGDRISARAAFTVALRAYTQAEVAAPGRRLGDACRPLLAGITQYWTLETEWRAWAEEADTDAAIVPHLQAARQALMRYVDDAWALATEPELFPIVTPIVLEMGSALIPEDTSTETWSLFTTYIPQFREGVRADTGVELPGVRVRGNNSLGPGDYVIMIDEIPRARGSVPPGMRFSPEPGERWLGVDAHQLVEDRDPRSRRRGFWVAPTAWEHAAALALELWAEPIVFVVRHLDAVLRRYLAEFLGVQEFEALLQAWSARDREAALIRGLTLDDASRLRLGRVMRALVRQRVSITKAEEILEAVTAQGLAGGTDAAVVAGVRARIKHLLPGNSRSIRRVELAAEWEARLAGWLQESNGRTHVRAPVTEAAELVATVHAALDQLTSEVVLIAPRVELQPFLRQLIAPEFPDVQVLAREEMVAPDAFPGPRSGAST